MRTRTIAGMIFTGLVVCAGTARAQEYPSWTGILYGGWSHASLGGTNQPFEGSGSREGGTGGVAFVLRTDDEFGVEFGARVTQKGADGAVDLTDYTQDIDASTPRILGDGTTSLTYVEIPVTFAGYLSAGSRAYLRGYLGLSLGVLVSANFSGTLEGSAVDIDIKDSLQELDFGWVIGASGTREMSGYSLWLDARYVGGARSIDNSGRDYEVHTNAFELALGIGLALGGE